MNISSSIRRLTQLFIVMFIALSGGLVYWQVVAAQDVTNNIHNGRRCLWDNAPIRGRIFDRNGVLLAESLKDPKASCGYVRHYTEPSLAGLIGYYGPNSLPTGIEAEYNSVLDGGEGSTALDNTINKILHRPPIGNDIYLTIDVRIQQLVNKDFDVAPDHAPDNDLLYASNRGAVVVSDPHTGELLAMVSRPSFDPNRMAQALAYGDYSYYNELVKEKDNPLAFRPLQSLYTPGSTFKTVTLMGALDSGKTTLNQQWDKDQAYGNNGKIYIDGGPITGDNLGYQAGPNSYTFHFPISTEYAYENSDNLVFANIGINTGLDTWTEYTKRLYFDQKVPFDLPNMLATSHVLHADGTPLSRYELATGAFGQGANRVTPLQMALVDNTVANDGVLMQPMLISKITDAQKNPITTFSPKELNTVVSQSSAAQVRLAMQAVTKCGGGYPITEIRNTQWGIIGKTGTGEVGGGLPAEGWMITQAPYYDNNPGKLPSLSIVAMKENAGEGAYAVGPMIAHMYADIFNSKLTGDVAPPENAGPDFYCRANNLWQR